MRLNDNRSEEISRPHPSPLHRPVSVSAIFCSQKSSAWNKLASGCWNGAHLLRIHGFTVKLHILQIWSKITLTERTPSVRLVELHNWSGSAKNLFQQHQADTPTNKHPILSNVPSLAAGHIQCQQIQLLYTRRKRHYVDTIRVELWAFWDGQWRRRVLVTVLKGWGQSSTDIQPRPWCFSWWLWIFDLKWSTGQ